MNPETDPDVRQAFQDLVSSQPFEPDPVALRSRARRAHRRAQAIRGSAYLGLAGVVATAAAMASTGTAHPTRSVSAPTVEAGRPTIATGRNPLARLSDLLLAAHTQPTGDATLEIKHSTVGTQSATTYSIFADNGKYYFSTSAAGLIAAVNGRSPGGATAKETAHSRIRLAEYVTAAKKAATGSLADARSALLDVGQPAGWTPPSPNQAQQAAGEAAAGQTENYIWENARVALITDPGDPTVRAGVFRVVATLKDVTVTHTTTDGQRTLTIQATGDAVGGGYERLVIAADTGIPISEAEGGSDTNNAARASYAVSRVRLADIAAGRL